MPTWLLDVLIILTVYRITRVVTRDRFPLVHYPRTYAVAYFDPDPEHRQHYPWARKRGGWVGESIAYLVTCDWCVSTYVGAGVVWLTTLWWSVPVPYLVWAASSAITGLIAQREPD